jgi:hypothetical protein
MITNTVIRISKSNCGETWKVMQYVVLTSTVILRPLVRDSFPGRIGRRLLLGFVDLIYV